VGVGDPKGERICLRIVCDDVAPDEGDDVFKHSGEVTRAASLFSRSSGSAITSAAPAPT
jgi:hypothetical protein